MWSMEFQHPMYLLLFAIIPVMIGWYRSVGNKKEGTIRISSTYYISNEIQKLGVRKNNFIKILYFTVLVLIITAVSYTHLTLPTKA